MQIDCSPREEISLGRLSLSIINICQSKIKLLNLFPILKKKEAEAVPIHSRLEDALSVSGQLSHRAAPMAELC